MRLRISFLVLWLAAAGCSIGDVCAPGTLEPCVGEDECEGRRRCDANGLTYGECACRAKDIEDGDLGELPTPFERDKDVFLGDFTIRTREDVRFINEFFAIDGDLSVEAEDDGPITLYSRRIRGELRVQPPGTSQISVVLPFLFELSGLVIDGDVEGLVSAPGLESVQGDVVINAPRADLDMPDLIRIEGNASLSGSMIQYPQAFRGVVVSGTLSFSGNPALTSIYNVVARRIRVLENPLLDRVNLFSSAIGDVEVKDCPAMRSLHASSTRAGNVRVHSPVLRTISLARVESIGDLEISRDEPGLAAWVHVDNLVEADSISLRGSTFLPSGLLKLVRLNGDLVVEGSDANVELDAPALTVVEGELKILSNLHIWSVDAPLLSRVGGDFRVVDNASLPECRVLEIVDRVTALDGIGGVVEVRGNDDQAVCP